MELIRLQSIIRDPFVARAAADVLRKQIVPEKAITRINNRAIVFNAFQESAYPGRKIQDAIRNIENFFKILEATNDGPNFKIQEVTEEEEEVIVSVFRKGIGGNLNSISSAAQEVARNPHLPPHITDDAEDVVEMVGKLNEKNNEITIMGKLSHFLKQ